ncbi:hypothetical protein Cgig2_025889 [Carnegiea gigantea]|uniref:DUF7780 domain-containing protein n=1 Tax=Carnegiea gigantea TaxID=171969 RepID=A0A9Q1K623_9CARY|nr:hypothetical protein Cgig2_025889 [Carnegiea gigantea]
MVGMGFLLVFFHHPDNEETNYTKKKPPFSLSSPRKPSNGGLLSKTQSTLSICGVLVFTTLLLFALSTFEPTTSFHHNNHHNHRRILRQNPQATHHAFSISLFFSPKSEGSRGNFAPALQGMGMLFRRGSKAMTDLVVGHVAEDADEREIATFIRLIHHSGLLSRSDLVLVFDSHNSASRLGGVVKSESDSFVRLVNLYRELNVSSSPGRGSGLNRYLREVGEDEKEPIWGKKRNSSWSPTRLIRTSYGSVVGFESSELDPENSLSGFLDRVPMSLRRWACYPMLLGRVRRHFKHTMLADVGNSLVLSDPFTRVRNRSSESVFVYSISETESARHGRRNSAKSHSHDRVNSADPRVVLGGSRGVRRFANAALTEIVRVVIEHKGRGGRNSVSESGLVNQLVHRGHLLKNVNIVTLAESIPEASALAGFNSLDSAGVVQRGRGGRIDIDLVIRRDICSAHELYSSVYRDCLDSQ